jgi:hypothetical protein
MGAKAQWTVVNLTPPFGGSSYADGVQGGQQVGTWSDAQAMLWSGSGNSAVNLHPVGAALYSHALDVHGGQQVGYVIQNGGGSLACLWTGTAASWVSLNPTPTVSSQAYGAGAGQQVGWITVFPSGSGRASLWRGTAASWVDLHPAGSTSSYARGVDGVQQVGYAEVGTIPNSNFHASVWSGTAASWVDLHPVGASTSYAMGVDGGQQGGYIIDSVDGQQHAGVWTGTAASFVDLHPAEALFSNVRGVHGGQQVGVAFMADGSHASLWSGTAGSWVDLNAFLPPGFTNSYARDIWHDGAFTYVVGAGALGGGEVALMWVHPIPEPGSLIALLTGLAVLSFRRLKRFRKLGSAGVAKDENRIACYSNGQIDAPVSSTSPRSRRTVLPATSQLRRD